MIEEETSNAGEVCETVKVKEQNKDQNGNDQTAFETLLEYLYLSRGFDFAGYKRPSLKRRILRRMQMINMARFEDYQDYLKLHNDEFASLFSTILINVTSFFRDRQAWDFLAMDIIPQLIQSKSGEEYIKIWSAGCSSGEEAYTLAMIMIEALGEETYKKRVKIFATDVDEMALTGARMGSYSPKDLEAVPALFRDKYFQQAGNDYVFRPELRRSIIFGRHDLLQDAPISHIDLLVCRNTLMYFNSQAQSKILARFHFALNDIGCLFLGRAELLLTHAHLFSPVDLKCRIFQKVPKANLPETQSITA